MDAPARTAVFDAALAADDVRRVAILGDAENGVRALPGTVWSSVPTSGQAIFRGVGVGHVAGATGDPDLTLRGDVYMTVNFGADDITGGMYRITASDTATIYELDGEISLLNGDIGVVRRNDFTLDYAGDFLVDGARYALDGNLDGLLRGTRFGVVRRSPIKALSAIDDDGTVFVDGTARAFDLTIVAETD